MAVINDPYYDFSDAIDVITEVIADDAIATFPEPGLLELNNEILRKLQSHPEEAIMAYLFRNGLDGNDLGDEIEVLEWAVMSHLKEKYFNEHIKPLFPSMTW